MIGFLLGVMFLIVLILLVSKFIKSANSYKKFSDNEIKIIFDKENVDEYFIGKDLKSAIGLDKKEKRLILLYRKTIEDKYIASPIPFSDVFEVKLNEDEIMITSTQRGSQLGGAVVGGAIFGGVGAIVGGLSGSKQNDKEVKTISLDIVVNDLTNPLYKINFMNEFFYINKNNPKYKEQFEEAERWYKIVSVIIKQNELNN